MSRDPLFRAYKDKFKIRRPSFRKKDGRLIFMMLIQARNTLSNAAHDSKSSRQMTEGAI